MNKRPFIGGLLVATVVILAVIIYLPPTDLYYVQSAIRGPFTVTITTTTVVVTSTATQLNDVMGQVMACSWNHSVDAIEFSITGSRTPSAPSDGRIMLYYIPNGHIYGPGGLFVFSSGSTTGTFSASASDPGFDRSRACIVSEWSPVFVE